MKLKQITRKGFLFMIAGFTALALHAQDKESINTKHWKAGQVRFDNHKWVEVVVGDMPLVISVPHGGLVHAPEIADRDCNDVGRVVKGVDTRTMETARAIEKHFLEKYGKRPYLVIAHLSRRKVDQNREIKLAACGDPVGEAAWHYYHSSLDSALADAVRKHGHATIVDLHGHGHTNQRLELGVLLSTQEMAQAYQAQNVSLIASKSSLYNYLRVHPKTDLQAVLFGQHAFGTIFYNQGVKATPALQDPHPQAEEPFFTGGYITQRYTSLEYPRVYGWQIECHYRTVRDTEESRQAFAEAFGEAYFGFNKAFPYKASKKAALKLPTKN